MATRFSHQCGGDSYRHPALVIEHVTIANRLGINYPQPLDVMIDTGADRSAVPSHVVAQLHDTPVDWKTASFADRSKPSTTFPIHLLWFRVPGLGESPLAVFALQRRNIIFGRDFLSAVGLLAIANFRTERFALRTDSRFRDLLLRALGL